MCPGGSPEGRARSGRAEGRPRRLLMTSQPPR
jgi:hypothetical protein